MTTEADDEVSELEEPLSDFQAFRARCPPGYRVVARRFECHLGNIYMLYQYEPDPDWVESLFDSELTITYEVVDEGEDE